MAKVAMIVRLDSHLHAAFKVLAHEKRVSVNGLLVHLIAQAVAQDDQANGDKWCNTETANGSS